MTAFLVLLAQIRAREKFPSTPSTRTSFPKRRVAQYKGYVEPYTFNFKKLLKALYHKEGAAQSEVDFFLENCAKKWQTRGTYQIKRQRLKPDVRDPPEHMVADIDIADI